MNGETVTINLLKNLLNKSIEAFISGIVILISRL